MAGQRRYQDGCPVALGMDLLGERWALLIVRELLLGPKRFSDLRVGLLGSSADMVTVRLRELQAHGIVQRRRLPAPASAWVYELTPWGAELEPIVTSLARWSIRSAEMAERVDRPVSVDSAVLGLRVLFDADAAADAAVTLELVVDAEPFRVDVHNGVLRVRRGEAPDADLRLVTDPNTLAGLLRGERSVEAERELGHVALTGDDLAARTFLSYFGAAAPETSR
jgi:DNA-binding HxlR family transcriptional regulator